jgi:hypothetical protein
MELRISTATTGIQWKTFLGGNELDHSYPTDFAIYLTKSLLVAAYAQKKLVS